MKQLSSHVHSAHHHSILVYPVSFTQRMYTIVFGPLVIVALVYLIAHLFPFINPPSGTTTSFTMILVAALETWARIAIAFACAILCAIPLALFVTSSAKAEAVLLPLFDIMQSVPVLALFPVIIMFFINDFNSLNGAAIFILFLSMLWNIVFAVVGGLKIIPQDIVSAAHIFGIRGFAFFRRVLLPAIVPQLVTGSILAVGQGWNLIIVAEVLHTYIPGGTAAQDLFGVGSILVRAAADAQIGVFIQTVFVMVVIIGFFNFFVWQKLLHYAQRFRFE
ncbi:MAG TPA: ABC transporter permease subunit [Candidatus Paceibacterota bacterium]|nr:ABC transporter permease subunit [Candidatus Paceibacterota bacterium]